MKKAIIGLLSVGLVFGVGTTVFGNANDEVDPNGDTTFEEMVPFMQEMHPDWSKEDMETMYNSCHGTNDNANPMRTGPSGMGMNQL